MKLFTLLLTLLYISSEVYSWRIFRNGRMVGGNIGEPKSDNCKESNVKEVQEEWFTQNLDHFNPTDETTWKQRYYSNDQFFDSKNGGPVFLMIGGEGEASIKWMTQGAWVNYAEKYGALMFQLEHRYYGKSHPTDDLSTKNLKYLTSQQALADLATFITAMNEKYNLPSDVKWIAFGGSYPGSLAAWLRFKYPHLVHGSMSASGPLLAQVDFKDYFRVIKESLATHSDDCVTAVQQGIDQIGVLLKQAIGQANLNELFKLCDPIQNSVNNEKDISNLYETIADDFAGVVQYNKDNRVGSPAGANITIDVVCDIMVNQTIGPPVNRLAKVNEVLLNAYDQKCLDYNYDKMINNLRNVSWDSEASEGGRQWTYQTCTEFGFYQTSDYEPQIFSDQFSVDFFIQQCTDIFGSIYDEDFLNDVIDRTNTYYGGLDIEVSNVVFVHGSIDPWHALGITKTIDENAPAIYIEGTAHCANMYPPADTDLPQLKEAREQILSLIGTWLGQ
ncbi:putative serine protease K12H4.7 [Tribolium madens]|uniref:putative serine protease K12H4.7 n=1 Tax=Tribolium madens TaxID=41895 RepID=UPI001CF73429|nr:putative serine protease K12H4.7 [Tribolium madens]